MTAKLAFGLAVALALAGCAWERTNRLGPIDPWPPLRSVEKPRSLALRIYGTRSFEGTPVEVEPRELSVWRDEALRAYSDSQLFSNVAATWEPTDIVAEVSITKSAAGLKGIPLIVGSLTYRQTDIEMRTRFRRADGTLLRLVELSEAIRTFNVLIGPDGESEDSLREILYDLHRATLSQAARGGVLKLGAQPGVEGEEKP
jgi:hypothetical protein